VKEQVDALAGHDGSDPATSSDQHPPSGAASFQGDRARELVVPALAGRADRVLLLSSSHAKNPGAVGQAELHRRRPRCAGQLAGTGAGIAA
jgi:hypothetical protein